MTNTITDFAKQFCGNVAADTTAKVLKTNYETCWRLAAQWSELIEVNYMNPPGASEEWSEDKALNATETVSRLMTAGNRAYQLYQKMDETQRLGVPAGGKPTLEQCIEIVKKHRANKVRTDYLACGWPKIEAIKDIRTLTSCGLLEGKNFVEAVDQQLKDELGDALIAEAADEASYR